MGTDTQTVGLPRPLERNTKIRETLRSLSPFSVTEEEQDNVGPRQQGSGHFRAARLGLGGAGGVMDATAVHREGARTSQGWERVPPLSGLHPKGRTRSVSRTDHRAERLDNHSGGGVT